MRNFMRWDDAKTAEKILQIILQHALETKMHNDDDEDHRILSSNTFYMIFPTYFYGAETHGSCTCGKLLQYYDKRED